MTRPSWLIPGGAVLVLAGAVGLGAILGHPPAPRPIAAQAAKAVDNPDLPPASAFDPEIIIDSPLIAQPGVGTAFSVSSGGVWLTARHVVEGCAKAVIVISPGHGVAAEVRLDPRGDTAVLITQGGFSALPFAPVTHLQRGMLGFHPGFPHGEPGEVVSHLERREVLVLRGQRTRRVPVLAWSLSEERRSLAGISGAPVLDAQGRVVGVTIAQSRRHGRVYTTTPTALRLALVRAHVEPAPSGRAAPMTEDDYPRIADVLRRDLRIAPVACLTDRAEPGREPGRPG